MCSRTWAARLTASLGLCLAVCGCVVLGSGRTPSDPDPIPPRPRPVGFEQKVPDLRIPGDTLAQAGPPPGKLLVPTDIPLVPLPLPPLVDTKVSSAAPSTANPPQPTNSPIMPLAQLPTVPDPSAGAVKTPKELYEQAAAAFAGVDSYMARLTRRETVKGKVNGEEIMMFAFRKQPWSVHFKWLAGDGAGREVVYVKDRFENKLHTLLAAGDMPLVPAGKRLSLPIDSIFVRSASKHPITEAGIGAMIGQIGRLLDANARGDKRWGKLTFIGVQNRPDYPVPLDMVEVKLPPRTDIDLPNGGRRLYGFDSQTHLPVLALLHDEHDRETEYYRFDRIQLSVNLDDADFDPDRLWPKADARPGNGGR